MTKKTEKAKKITMFQEVINVYSWKINPSGSPEIYYSDTHKSLAEAVDGLVENIKDLGTLNIYNKDGKRVYKFTEITTVYTDNTESREKIDLSNCFLIKQAQMAYEKKLESEQNKCEDDHLSFDESMDLIINEHKPQEIEDYRPLLYTK